MKTERPRSLVLMLRLVTAGLTRQACVGSLFHCHNETGMQAGDEGVSIIA